MTSEQAQLQSEFARATSALRAGELQVAETACRNILLKLPRNAAAIHLLGLVRKDAGDLAGGEQLMRQSLALEPRNAEFRVNFGNLLRRSGRLTDAVGIYREALGIDQRHRGALLGLARSLNDLSRHTEAEAEARKLVALAPQDPHAWSTLAMTLRDQQLLTDAEAAYQRAIALAPNDGAAHHNLGSVLARMDRAEEALATLARAQALGVDGFELAFNRGNALLQLYRIDEAEAAFARAVDLQPLHGDAQVNLARLRFMRGDPDFARGIVAAAAAHRGKSQIQVLLARVLRRAGDLAGAEALLRDEATLSGGSPTTRGALAEVLLDENRLNEAEIEALAAVTAQPDDGAYTDTLVTILMARGRIRHAVPFIRRQRQLFPQQQGWIAHEAVAARLLADPLYQHLYDYDRLVRSYDLESPPGWGSMAELNNAALAALHQRHRFNTHPLDQSLRNGSQTTRNLLMDDDPAIRALLQAFTLPIEDYCSHLGSDAAHPLSARNAGVASLFSAWSVQLRREGFHVNHVHPQGWLSSAYYVAVPEETRDESLKSGWLKFGETRYPVPGATAEGVVQPLPGRLVLFPSYMWHGTTPIHGDQTRTTIAFDAVPGQRR